MLAFVCILAKILKHSLRYCIRQLIREHSKMELFVFVASSCVFSLEIFAYSSEIESDIPAQGKRQVVLLS